MENKNVWVLLHQWDWNGADLVGVYTSEEKAEQAKLKFKDGSHDKYLIELRELDRTYEDV